MDLGPHSITPLQKNRVNYNMVDIRNLKNRLNAVVRSIIVIRHTIDDSVPLT